MARNKGTRKAAAQAATIRLAPATADSVETPRRLLVVRESDASDLVLFEDMAYKTISLVAESDPAMA